MEAHRFKKKKKIHTSILYENKAHNQVTWFTYDYKALTIKTKIKTIT